MEASALKQEEEPEPEPRLNIIIDDARWSDRCDIKRLSEQALQVLKQNVSLPKAAFALNILFTDDQQVQTLNRQFRGKDQPTNILSFPNSLPEELASYTGNALPELGDMALAYTTCNREATEQQKPFAHHTTHLLIHGILHLLGYDHEEDVEAAEMEALEIRLLHALSIPNPYEVDTHE